MLWVTERVTSLKLYEKWSILYVKLWLIMQKLSGVVGKWHLNRTNSDNHFSRQRMSQLHTLSIGHSNISKSDTDLIGHRPDRTQTRSDTDSIGFGHGLDLIRTRSDRQRCISTRTRLHSHPTHGFYCTDPALITHRSDWIQTILHCLRCNF